jgi:hypothetical protein
MKKRRKEKKWRNRKKRESKNLKGKRYAKRGKIKVKKGA